mgnify:CR=1 FL=1
MKRILKIVLWTIVLFIVVIVGAGATFIYKVKNGFPVSYETEAPVLDIPAGKRAVLLFSKSTGFRHEESIEAGKNKFLELAQNNGWFLYSTEEGGVFNAEQLSKFDVVVFNNCTGRLLNEEQQQALQDYVNKGGRFIGIHGAGDNSHHRWPWYQENLIGAHFSHHSLEPQLQEASVTLNNVQDSTLTAGLPAEWLHTDEWYVFLDNPRANGFEVLYNIDGTAIKPSGNLLWMKGMDFGMGKDHPVAWYRRVGQGRTLYTSIGHNATAWKQGAFVRMLQNAVNN